MASVGLVAAALKGKGKGKGKRKGKEKGNTWERQGNDQHKHVQKHS